eukprot:TRINITY_DN4604_c0_g1_i1.p1 TRINITY_DN4604_c0_g1~~TRINITY_DN4604_c0_g1_i1.p1  ORF type:complete len:1150 (-),score=255.56 TRINITY_DN4604_c0_g1_i1:39-3488(-)
MAGKHTFILYPVKSPHRCDHCKDYVWKRVNVCQDCKIWAHEKCTKHIISSCTNNKSKLTLVAQVTPKKRVWNRHDGSCPSVVEQSINHLLHNKEAIETEGIFRVSPEISELQALKAKFEQSTGTDLLIPKEFIDSDYVHVVTGVLKLFFRELEEPLFTFDLYETFVTLMACKDLSEENCGECLRHTLRLLPSSCFVVVDRLTQLLQKITQSKEVNKMGASNLAIVFSPTVLRPRVETIETMLQDADALNKLVETLIVRQEFMFSEPKCPFPTNVPAEVLESYQKAEGRISNKLKEMEKEKKLRENKIKEDKRKTLALMGSLRDRNAITIQSWWRGILLRLRLKGIRSRSLQTSFNRCLWKLITNEKRYVANLMDLTTIYLNIFRLSAKPGKSEEGWITTKKNMVASKNPFTGVSISDEHISTVFMNVESILDKHRNFLHSLVKLWDKWPFIHYYDVSGIFNKSLLPFVGDYTYYVKNFFKSLKTLNHLKASNADLKNWLKRLKNTSKAEGLSLKELIELPLKYFGKQKTGLQKLITVLTSASPKLKEDLNLTDPITSLFEVLAFVRRFDRIVVDTKKEEGVRIVSTLDSQMDNPGCLTRPNRELVQRGSGVIASEKRQMLLFNDGQLLLLKKKLLSTSKRYHLDYMIDIKLPLCRAEEGQNSKSLILQTAERAYHILFKTRKRKTNWLFSLDSTIHFARHGVIGMPLTLLIKRDSRLPFWMTHSIRHLTQIASKTGGLFCIFPDYHLISQLRAIIEDEETREGASAEEDPRVQAIVASEGHVVAGLLRSFFEGQPEPLLPADACLKAQGSGLSLSSLVQLLKSLPSQHVPFLQQLLVLWDVITSRDSDQVELLASAISTSLSWGLRSLPQSSDFLQVAREVEASTGCIAALIRSQAQLPDLLARAKQLAKPLPSPLPPIPQRGSSIGSGLGSNSGVPFSPYATENPNTSGSSLPPSVRPLTVSADSTSTTPFPDFTSTGSITSGGSFGSAIGSHSVGSVRAQEKNKGGSFMTPSNVSHQNNNEWASKPAHFSSSTSEIHTAPSVRSESSSSQAQAQAQDPTMFHKTTGSRFRAFTTLLPKVTSKRDDESPSHISVNSPGTNTSSPSSGLSSIATIPSSSPVSSSSTPSSSTSSTKKPSLLRKISLLGKK